MPSTAAVDWISLWKQGRVAVQAGSPRILNEYETPTTFVFLTATHAFKLRKPVVHGAIDYRTEPQRRLAARTAMVSGQKVEGGQDYGGVPAKPVREWLREIHAVRQLLRRRKQDDNG